MSASPLILPPSPMMSRRSLRNAWIPVVLSLIFVRCTSTSFAGGSHTQILVDAVWRTFLGKWHWNLTGIVNEDCRKVGHFFGYGMIGLIFRNAWYNSVRAGILRIGESLATVQGMISISALSVLSTFLIACVDEIHQRYVPGRVSSFRDVMVDTTGAAFLNLVFWLRRAHMRKQALA